MLQADTFRAPVSNLRPYFSNQGKHDAPKHPGLVRIEEICDQWGRFHRIRAWYLQTEIDRALAPSPSRRNAANIQKLAAERADLEGQIRTVANALASARADYLDETRAAVAASLVREAMALVPDFEAQRRQMHSSTTPSRDRDRFL